VIRVLREMRATDSVGPCGNFPPLCRGGFTSQFLTGPEERPLRSGHGFFTPKKLEAHGYPTGSEGFVGGKLSFCNTSTAIMPLGRQAGVRGRTKKLANSVLFRTPPYTANPGRELPNVGGELVARPNVHRFYQFFLPQILTQLLEVICALQRRS